MKNAKYDEAELQAFIRRMKTEPENVYAEQAEDRRRFMEDPANAEALRLARFRVSLAVRAEKMRRRAGLSTVEAADACRAVARSLDGVRLPCNVNAKRTSNIERPTSN